MTQTNRHAASVTQELAEDIYAATGLTPHTIAGAFGAFLIVCDNHEGQYVLSNRASGLPDGFSLMLIHDQSAIGGEHSLLLDLVGLDGSLHSLAETNEAVCEQINAMQRVRRRLTTEGMAS